MKRKMFEHSELLLAACRTKLAVKRGKRVVRGQNMRHREGYWGGRTGIERERLKGTGLGVSGVDDMI